MKQKHKHWFEIKAFADGWGILHKLKVNKEWLGLDTPMWNTHESNLYVINDALVEFRKAEKEGKVIQFNSLGTSEWNDVIMNSFDPSDIWEVSLFRIKPKIDLSILNDEDWFYVNFDESMAYLCKGAFTQSCTAYNIYTGVFYLKTTMSLEDVKILRKATPEDLQPMFEKYPELAPPKVGDWGWFWDDNKETAMIDKFSGMYAESFLSTKTIIGYLNFQKIDTSKSLDEIIKEFKTEN